MKLRTCVSLKMNRTALLISILFISTTFSEGCQCLPGSLSFFFENADSVIKATVVGVRKLYKDTCMGRMNCVPIEPRSVALADRLMYTMSVSQVLKGCGPFGIMFTAVSMISGAQCGIQLKEGQVWMLNLAKVRSVKLRGGQSNVYELNMCQGHRPWLGLKEEELEWLKSVSRRAENQCVI